MVYYNKERVLNIVDRACVDPSYNSMKKESTALSWFLAYAIIRPRLALMIA